MVSTEAAVGRVLCLLPGSVGHLSNQPQEVWTMGRWAGSHVFILLSGCVLPLSVPHSICWSDFHVPIPVVTGASDGIGRGYALEVSITSSCCCSVN